LSAARFLGRCSGWRTFVVVVYAGIFACEFALEAPERCFGEGADAGGIAGPDFPVDFRVLRSDFLDVWAVVDGELVVIC
jgi:hypothetical protein